METKLFIPVLLGTTRKERKSEHVANWLVDHLSTYKGVEIQLFDVRDFDFSGDEGESLKDQNPDWRDAVTRADGLIIIAPEYNHGYPGSLKMAIDILFSEYNHKPVGIVGVSAGGFGGTRVIENLLSVLREVGLVTSSVDLQVSRVGNAFAEDGALLDDKLPERADRFIHELLWLAQSLKWGRDNLED